MRRVMTQATERFTPKNEVSLSHQDSSRACMTAKRFALFRQADVVMATEVPAVPLWQRPAPLVHRSDLLGMLQNPSDFGPFWNIEAWRWRR